MSSVNAPRFHAPRAGMLPKGVRLVDARILPAGLVVSRYKMHGLGLHGVVKVSLDSLARLAARRTESHVKLH